MSKLLKKLFWAFVVLFLLASIIVPTLNYLAKGDSQEMIETTLEWGRLAPFPENLQKLEIVALGNAFTREFRAWIKFNDKESLEKWIQDSPGLQDAVKEERSGIIHYDIKPGGGAAHAEADIDMETKSVQIDVYWS